MIGKILDKLGLLKCCILAIFVGFVYALLLFIIGITLNF